MKNIIVKVGCDGPNCTVEHVAEDYFKVGAPGLKDDLSVLGWGNITKGSSSLDLCPACFQEMME